MRHPAFLIFLALFLLFLGSLPIALSLQGGSAITPSTESATMAEPPGQESSKSTGLLLFATISSLTLASYVLGRKASSKIRKEAVADRARPSKSAAGYASAG